MPFLSDDTEAVPAGLAPQVAEPAAVVPPVPPFGRLWDAATANLNPYASATEAATQPRMAPYDPNYDPFKNIAGYEDYAASFAGANTDDDLLHVKTRIDAERRNSDLLASGGWRGMVAAIGAGSADPIMLVPVGGELVAVSRLGRVLAGAARTGATFGAVTAAQEAILGSTQITRTLGESATNVAASTLLGGVLGGAVGTLGRPITQEVAQSAARAGEVYERELAANASPAGIGGSVGAASARGETTIAQETIANALGVDKALAFSSPTLRLGTSPSVETRRIAQELADQPLDIRKNAEGIPTPISVERRIMQAQAPLAEGLVGLDDAFVQYRLGRDRAPLDIARIAAGDVVGRTGGKMTYDEFKRAVGMAMRRGDQSDIPEVAQAATLLRTKVFDPLKEKAIAAGLLPEDVSVDTALSYFTRVYNTGKIAAQRPQFEKILTDWLANLPEIKAQRLDELDLQDISRQITDNLLHAAPNRSTYLPVPLTRGPLRERTLSIPDNMIEDYLESDVQRIARVYTRTMAADTELASAFGRADMEQQLDRVREQYAVLRQGVTDERALTKLDKSMRDDLRDLAAVRDRVRGTYGLPQEPNGLWNRAYHVVRDLNYLRLLGGMTISAFPDLGRTVMVHGLMRVAGDGLVPMLRDFHQFRLAANEVKLAGNALDMVLDSRAMSLADMMDDYGRWSRYERGLKAMTERFGLVTLMAPWNASLKQFVGVISQTRSLQAIEKMVAGGAVSQAERTRLASLGLGSDYIGRIDAMFREHGTKDGGTWWANTAAWPDTAAADAFRAAMSKEVDIAIVQPGQEKPLWMTKGIGRAVAQFRSFTIASTQRVLMTGLQKRDMAALNGTILMAGLGTFSWWLKRQMNPNSQPLPDPSTASGAASWLREGIDQAGLVGWLFDVHNIVEKATRGTVGFSRLVGGPPMTRYASRGVLESLLGPTVGFGEAAMGALGSAGAGEWKDSDTTAVRRMVPMQNLIGLRHLFDLAEHGLNSSLGVAERH